MVVLIDSPVPRSTLHYLWAEAVLNWTDVRSADGPSAGGGPIGAPVPIAAASTGDVHRPGGLGSDSVIPGQQGSRPALPARSLPGRPDHHANLPGCVMALGHRELGWKRVAEGSLHCIDIPGLHNSMFDDPQVEFVGRELDQALERADRRGERYGRGRTASGVSVLHVSLPPPTSATATTGLSSSTEPSGRAGSVCPPGGSMVIWRTVHVPVASTTATVSASIRSLISMVDGLSAKLRPARLQQCLLGCPEPQKPERPPVGPQRLPAGSSRSP